MTEDPIVTSGVNQLPKKSKWVFPNQKLGRFLGPPSARAARVQVPTFL